MLSSHSSFIVTWDKFDTRKWKCFQYSEQLVEKPRKFLPFLLAMQFKFTISLSWKQNYAPKNLWLQDRCKREMSLLVVSMSGTVKNVDSLMWTSGRISHLLNFRLVTHYFQVKTVIQCHSFVWLRACCQVNAGKTLSTLHINRFLFISFLRA